MSYIVSRLGCYKENRIHVGVIQLADVCLPKSILFLF